MKGNFNLQCLPLRNSPLRRTDLKHKPGGQPRTRRGRARGALGFYRTVQRAPQSAVRPPVEAAPTPVSREAILRRTHRMSTSRWSPHEAVLEAFVVPARPCPSYRLTLVPRRPGRTRPARAAQADASNAALACSAARSPDRLARIPRRSAFGRGRDAFSRARGRSCEDHRHTCLMPAAVQDF
jgi:hypothetical protein